ncbi:unnamed protein product [Oikopleura dioica]|uniref:Uncharacterized protein n=1 Tax=Oikopleura dioica TaxID=34765 RepID=E4X4E9_OIKDI|nr:unnamed protein product [Oikopleura dioica]
MMLKSALAFLLTQTHGQSNCPDQDLQAKCEGICGQNYFECTGLCNGDHNCELLCLNDLPVCALDCPCAVNCPNGCDGCPNEVCSCYQPQLDSPFYKTCMSEASTMFNGCVMGCPLNTTCHENCFSDFQDEAERCPCADLCPDGCPCDNGFKCQDFVMIMGDSGLNRVSTMVASDGELADNRFYETPAGNANYGYLQYAGYEMLKGNLYIFGGLVAPTQISILVDCEIKPLTATLQYGFQSPTGAISTLPGIKNEVFLCFYASPYTKCEEFDGESSEQNPAITTNSHRYGALAVYGTGLLAVGSTTTSVANKVELLNIGGGWQAVADHPRSIKQPGIVSVDEGVLTLGGYQADTSPNAPINEVYLFKDLEWKMVGRLTHASHYNSVIRNGKNIINVPGLGSRVVESLSWDGYALGLSSDILELPFEVQYPILFNAAPDACVDSCENYCFV